MSKIIKYDFHTHILPGFDDGCKDMEQSISIIDTLISYGITDIAITPHFYTNEESVEDFLKRREDKYIELLNSVKNKNVKLHLGAEVFITDYLFNQKFDNRLCYDGKNYLLTEFSYDSDFSGRFGEYIDNLLDMDIIPVIAHVERYPKLMKNQKKREELIKQGVVFQSNFTSFTEFSLKKKILKMIKNNEIKILGSDVHSFHRNSPENYIKATEFIVQKLGEEFIDIINENSKLIL